MASLKSTRKAMTGQCAGWKTFVVYSKCEGNGENTFGTVLSTDTGGNSMWLAGGSPGAPIIIGVLVHGLDVGVTWLAYHIFLLYF